MAKKWQTPVNVHSATLDVNMETARIYNPVVGIINRTISRVDSTICLSALQIVM